MEKQKLIEQYQKKIAEKDEVIEIITQMIRNVRNGDKTGDIDDLTFEKQNAQRDRQLYFQFTKDLEDLTVL